MRVSTCVKDPTRSVPFRSVPCRLLFIYIFRFVSFAPPFCGERRLGL